VGSGGLKTDITLDEEDLKNIVNVLTNKTVKKPLSTNIQGPLKLPPSRMGGEMRQLENPKRKEVTPQPPPPPSKHPQSTRSLTSENLSYLLSAKTSSDPPKERGTLTPSSLILASHFKTQDGKGRIYSNPLFPYLFTPTKPLYHCFPARPVPSQFLPSTVSFFERLLASPLWSSTTYTNSTDNEVSTTSGPFHSFPSLTTSASASVLSSFLPHASTALHPSPLSLSSSSQSLISATIFSPTPPVGDRSAWPSSRLNNLPLGLKLFIHKPLTNVKPLPAIFVIALLKKYCYSHLLPYLEYLIGYFFIYIFYFVYVSEYFFFFFWIICLCIC
jgi:hypothetical protein